MSLLEVTGVRKSYGDAVVLAGLDLMVAEGECVVLIGGSGSGKSTLLRCVNLLEVIDDGVIMLDGVDVSDPRTNVDEVRSRVGIVFQSFNLFPHLNVLDNITLAPRHVHKQDRAEAEAQGWEMLARVGLAGRERAKPDELSGGQQQRVAIARALVGRPRMLLLDEVTSALDPELVSDVLDLLRDLSTDGMTMLLATHEMGFARQVADRVCFLDGGRILEQGTPEQVLEHPREPRTAEFLRRLLS